MTWTPSVGAWPEGGATRFRLWAPEAASVEVIVDRPATGDPDCYHLAKGVDGYYQTSLPEVQAGDRYRYRLDGRGPYPDPASRYQPLGVHGPSQVVDPGAFQWSDQLWTGLALEDLILYELHVGTFTPAGTFASAREQLPTLKDLGVTAVEIMPVADFAGQYNWGYDGTALFAPARCYGTPDDLRRFVDDAHRIGLAIHLDVVYNHLGPDGAYLETFSPYYFSTRHQSPWGAGVNFDGPHNTEVRRFFIENALHWIHEYHIDGLRLDATHAIVDQSQRHVLAELAAALRQSLDRSGRKVHVIAEDVRNLATMIKPESEQGWGLDAIWSDDFHHQIRRSLAGDHDGYFQDFSGTMQDIASTIKAGWFCRGEPSRYFGQARGTDPSGLTPTRFVFFIQNHDQVGNRALGDRIHHQIDLAIYRAVTALLLLVPQIPLLFMGQEWAASTPFLFFTDHHEELGKIVSQGRRREFSQFEAFRDKNKRAEIPDPQDPKTFQASFLRWQEQKVEPHGSVLRLYKKLLELRRVERALRVRESRCFELDALDDGALLLRRFDPLGSDLLAVFRLRGPGVHDLRTNPLADARDRSWKMLLTTEDVEFAPNGRLPKVDLQGPIVDFPGPAALLLRAV